MHQSMAEATHLTWEHQESIQQPHSNARTGHTWVEKLGQKTSSQGNAERKEKEKEKNMQLAKTGKDKHQQAIHGVQEEKFFKRTG